MTKDGVPVWKPPVNNGTELWEANLRNGGQPPPPQAAKTPWGHTPSTNIGGTWGEDDEAADSSNMWTGTPTPSQPNTTQWPGTSGNQTGMWPGGMLCERWSCQLYVTLSWCILAFNVYSKVAVPFLTLRFLLSSSQMDSYMRLDDANET